MWLRGMDARRVRLLLRAPRFHLRAWRYRGHVGGQVGGSALQLVALIIGAGSWLTAQGLGDRAQGRDDALHQNFFQSQGTHFTVLFEGPQDYTLASRAVEVLEEAYSVIGTELATFPDGTLTIILYTQQQFQDITRAPAWAAGAYDGRIRLPIRGALDRPEELRRVLFHELTHAMVQTIAPRRVPMWLNEGLAVVFEPGGVAWARGRLAASPRRLPFARLASSFQGLSGADAGAAYAQSAVIARRLIDEGGGHAVVAILRDLAAGRSFEEAFEQRLFLSYDSFLGTLDMF